ncbi:hypothetical protein L3X38_017991 [Prunus dulcis]|uniref:Uncharacterized protein n=1 Tax=Prunus dulcis TaxID=3755 RepID=A0AAD4W9Z1_PRUDU|nr:hypothetical protein L3X38_017991 [Prunus dulcis]
MRYALLSPMLGSRTCFPEPGEPIPPPPPSPPLPLPPPVGEEAGENELDLRHVLDQFTRTVTMALQGRRNTKATDIKKVKELGPHEFFGSATEVENWLTDIERVFEVMQHLDGDRVRGQAADRVLKKLSAGPARRRRDTSGFGGSGQGPSKKGGSSSSSVGSGWFGGRGSSSGSGRSGPRPAWS